MTDAEQEDIERRLAGLEKMAIDAIGSARKCITDALQRHDDRLTKLELLVSHPMYVREEGGKIWEIQKPKDFAG